MQLSVIFLLCILIIELTEFSETYKPIRSYKFYNPYPWRSPRQWHPFRKSPKHYRPKRILPQKYHVHELDYERYAPIYEDSVNNMELDKPYVIIIQLPQKKEKDKYHSYQRQHVIDAPRNIAQYIADDDNNDNDDDEVKVYHINNKTVRIKVNDRLSVLTS